MNYTENLSLGLPEYGESADVAALNRNSGILDAYVYNSRQMECEPYDSTKTYMSGDLAIHNEVIYECNTDNTTGTWDDSKWDSTTLAEQIAKAKQSGGESALADLDDVEITNPSTGQALLFDDDDDLWKNQNLPDASVTKEASGNPIELTDAAAAPIVKCVTQITGSQDLHGYDKPWVGGAGKNKLQTTGTSSTINGVTFTVNDDGTVNVNGTASDITTWIIGLITVESGKTYTLSGSPNNPSVNSYWIDVRDGSSIYNNWTEGNPTYTATETKQVNVRIRIASGYTINNLVFKPQIEVGSTATTFAPYSNICPITAYTEGEIEVRGKNIFNPDTVTSEWGNNFLALGGILSSNVPDGTITLKAGTYTLSNFPNKEIRRFDESGARVQTETGDMTFTLSKTEKVRFAIATENISFNIQLEENTTPTTYEPYKGTTHTTTYPSAIYRGSEDVVNGSVDTEKIKINVKWGDVTGVVLGDYTRKAFPLSVSAVNNDSTAICNVSPLLADYTSDSLHFYVSSANAYVFLPNDTDGNTDIEVAYTLATPTTSSVTPTNLPIKSLSGYNHIESSTGEMEVEYITSEYQPLVDLIQSSKHVYSTQEQIVGTWIDGSDVYEKTIDLGADSVVDHNGKDITSLTPSGINFTISCVGQCSTYHSSTSLLIDYTQSIQKWNIYSGVATYIRYVTIRYTKSTTTRSLNTSLTSQKAQIEPLTDKTEEVPTEEEKAVNEEDNNDETR